MWDASRHRHLFDLGRASRRALRLPDGVVMFRERGLSIRAGAAPLGSVKP